MDRLTGKTAIVTGAGRGIGKGIAKCLAKEGAYVVIATLDEKEGQALEKEIGTVQSYFVATDVASEESIKYMVAKTVEVFGKLDILINNAGITRFKPMEETTIEDWDSLINVDLRGPFITSKYAVPHMKKQQSGSIVNISSNHSSATLPHTEVYAAAKGGLNAMSKSMALSLGEDGIRVNTISPGFTDTPHYRKWLTEKEDSKIAEQEVKKVHPLKKISRPEDIGYLAAFLCSEEAAMVTGENIIIDGGVSARLYNSDYC